MGLRNCSTALKRCRALETRRREHSYVRHVPDHIWQRQAGSTTSHMTPFLDFQRWYRTATTFTSTYFMRTSMALLNQIGKVPPYTHETRREDTRQTCCAKSHLARECITSSWVVIHIGHAGLTSTLFKMRLVVVRRIPALHIKVLHLGDFRACLLIKNFVQFSENLEN